MSSPIEMPGADMRERFDGRVKYPRTRHFEFSNTQGDDVILADSSGFSGESVVVTEKIDGENTNMYRNFLHARSLDEVGGIDYSNLRALHARLCHDIPEGWRVCGENAEIKHSIHYTHLRAYFQIFSIWNERNESLSWQETCEWAALLGVPTVPVIYEGVFDIDTIRATFAEYERRSPDEVEGFVVRVARTFAFSEFHQVVGKYVRPNHVRTTRFWRYEVKIKNKILFPLSPPWERGVGG